MKAGRKERDYTHSGVWATFLWFCLVFQRGEGASGGPLGVRPLPSLQTGVRMSINHLLIITALPAHNEKVKLSDIAPEAVYETTVRASEVIPNPRPRRSEPRRTGS